MFWKAPFTAEVVEYLYFPEKLPDYRAFRDLQGKNYY